MVYGILDQKRVDLIVNKGLPLWEIRLLVYKEDLYKVLTFHDTSYLPVEELPPVEEFTACVEYVAIRGEVLSTCEINRVPFWSAASGD